MRLEIQTSEVETEVPETVEARRAHTKKASVRESHKAGIAPDYDQTYEKYLAGLEEAEEIIRELAKLELEVRHKTEQMERGRRRVYLKTKKFTNDASSYLEASRKAYETIYQNRVRAAQELIDITTGNSKDRRYLEAFEEAERNIIKPQTQRPEIKIPQNLLRIKNRTNRKITPSIQQVSNIISGQNPSHLTVCIYGLDENCFM